MFKICGFVGKFNFCRFAAAGVLVAGGVAKGNLQVLKFPGIVHIEGEDDVSRAV